MSEEVKTTEKKTRTKKDRTKKKRKPVEEEVAFEEQEVPSAVELFSDLDGAPRPDEKYELTIKGKVRSLVPASLRNVPKVGEIVQSFTSDEDGEGDEDGLALFSEEKMKKIAELIYLSLSKEDQEEVDEDDILDSCGLADFPLAFNACLNLNDFLARMGQVKGMMRNLI